MPWVSIAPADQRRSRTDSNQSRFPKRGDECSHIRQRRRIQDLVYAGGFLARLDDSHLLKNNFCAARRIELNRQSDQLKDEQNRIALNAERDQARDVEKKSAENHERQHLRGDLRHWHNRHPRL